MTQIQLQLLHAALVDERNRKKEKITSDFDNITSQIRQNENDRIIAKLSYQNRRTTASSSFEDLQERFHVFFKEEYACKALSLGIEPRVVQELFLMSREDIERIRHEKKRVV